MLWQPRGANAHHRFARGARGAVRKCVRESNNDPDELVNLAADREFAETLRVKVKITAGGNSGIQYRGQSRPDLGLDVVTGYQCDVVADTPTYNGMLYEEKGRRILSHTGEKVIVDSEGQSWVVGKMPVKVFAPDEWHEYRVLVQGNHHQHWRALSPYHLC